MRNKSLNIGKIISVSDSSKAVMSCLAAISPDYPFGVFPEELLVRLVKNATSTAQYVAVAINN